MRRDELVRKIRKAAKHAEIDFDLVREGGNHSIFRCGSTPVVVPRHTDINELTARRIMKDLEDELGSGWWQ